MNAETVNAIKNAITPLAEKLGQGAEFLYSVYFRQTMIDGAIQIVVGVIGIIASLVGLYFLFKKLIPQALKTSREYWLPNTSVHAPDGVFEDIVAFVVGVASVIILFSSSAGIVGGVKRVANPHFYTIDRIINSVQAKEVQ